MDREGQRVPWRVHLSQTESTPGDEGEVCVAGVTPNRATPVPRFFPDIYFLVVFLGLLQILLCPPLTPPSFLHRLRMSEPNRRDLEAGPSKVLHNAWDLVANCPSMWSVAHAHCQLPIILVSAHPLTPLFPGTMGSGRTCVHSPGTLHRCCG